MASLIPKVNATTGSATAPGAGALVTGELAENKFTGRLYVKTESAAVVDPARVTLSGDVTGSTATATSEAQGGTITATVARIQGRTVAGTAPANGETLAWNAGTSQFEPKSLQVQTAKTAAYPLVLNDANTLIPFNLSAPANCTIPLNSTQAFPIGTQILIQQVGVAANQVTIVATGGVTLQSSKTKTNTQWSIITLIKTATDTWALGGDLI
jgi:hypothetical protein